MGAALVFLCVLCSHGFPTKRKACAAERLQGSPEVLAREFHALHAPYKHSRRWDDAEVPDVATNVIEW